MRGSSFSVLIIILFVNIFILLLYLILYFFIIIFDICFHYLMLNRSIPPWLNHHCGSIKLPLYVRHLFPTRL